MRPADYANHSARARTIAWALDLALSPLIGAPRSVEGDDRSSVHAPPQAAAGLANTTDAGPARQRILLIRPDHAGDLLMATPAIRALRRAHPDATIDLLASPWGAPAVAENPDLDRVLTIEATWFEPGRRDGPDPSRLIGSVLALRWPAPVSGHAGAGMAERAPRQARKAETLPGARTTADEGMRPRRYAAAADLRGDFRSILLARASGARRRVGFSRVGLERLLTDTEPLDPRMDHVSRNHAVLRLLGAGPLEARRPVFVVPARAEARARALLASLPADRPIVVVHPGTNRPWASWGAERFAEAVGRLAARRPIAVVADGRAADREATARVAAVAALHGAATIDLAGRTDFAEAAAIVGASSVLLGNDSGAAHLAVAVGTPVAAIFGPTDPALFWTWDDPGRNVAVAGPSACPRPCFQSHCPRDHGYDRISPGDVADLLERLIDAPARAAGGGAGRTREPGESLSLSPSTRSGAGISARAALARNESVPRSAMPDEPKR